MRRWCGSRGGRGGRREERPGVEISSVPTIKSRAIVIVNEEICKGCGLCISVCPRHAMGLAKHINARGFHPAAPLSPEKCTACAQCAIMCPDSCITILKRDP